MEIKKNSIKPSKILEKIHIVNTRPILPSNYKRQKQKTNVGPKEITNIITRPYPLKTKAYVYFYSEIFHKATEVILMNSCI